MFSAVKGYQILVAHPINKQRLKQGKIPATGIICRSAGQINSIHNLLNYYKVKTAVVSGELTVQGLSKLFGFTMINRPEFTAMIDTDLKEKVGLALQAMQHHDLVYLHIKGTDICAHDHQAKLKSRFMCHQKYHQSAIKVLNIFIAATIPL